MKASAALRGSGGGIAFCMASGSSSATHKAGLCAAIAHVSDGTYV